ncbi:hypothetical protein HDU86_005216 [Geranomyces michiganensis]|nr:hypothetical protein HDU86_005216 [Geranomyces michiganensis]
MANQRLLSNDASASSHPLTLPPPPPRSHQHTSRHGSRAEVAKAAERDDRSESLTFAQHPVAVSPSLSPAPSLPPSPSLSPPTGRRKHRHSRNVSVPSPPSPSALREVAAPKQNAGLAATPRPILQTTVISKLAEGNGPQSMSIVSRSGIAAADSPATRRMREPRDVRHSASASRLRPDPPATPPAINANSGLKVPTTKISHTRSHSNPGSFASIGECDGKTLPASPESLIQSLLCNVPGATPASDKPTAEGRPAPQQLKPVTQHQHSYLPYSVEQAKWTHGTKPVVVRGSQLRNPTPSPPPSYEDVLNESRLLISAYDRNRAVSHHHHYHHHHPHSQPCDCQSPYRAQHLEKPPQWYSPFSSGLDFDMTTAVDAAGARLGTVKRRLSVGALSALSPTDGGGVDGGLAQRKYGIDHKSAWNSSLLRDRMTSAISGRLTASAPMPVEPSLSPPPLPPPSPPHHLASGPPPGFRPFQQHQQKQNRVNALVAQSKGAPSGGVTVTGDYQAQQRPGISISAREPIPRPQGFSLFDRRMSFVVGRSGGAR